MLLANENNELDFFFLLFLLQFLKRRFIKQRTWLIELPVFATQ